MEIGSCIPPHPSFSIVDRCRRLGISNRGQIKQAGWMSDNLQPVQESKGPFDCKEAITRKRRIPSFCEPLKALL
jgi:hypothetical protein